MPKSKPRVSIGLPVYNGEKYLNQAIESILSQTYNDFELIILDNASTDKTQEICLDYASKDSRIRYYRNDSNLGLNPNFNRVFELAVGEYFTFHAHDDHIAPDFIDKCIKVLDDDPSIVLCHCLVSIIDEQGDPGPHYDDRLNFPNEGSVYPHERFRDLIMTLHICVAGYGLMQTKVLANIKPLYESHYGADRNKLAELSLHGKFYHIPEVLFFWRDEQEKYWQYNSWLNRIQNWDSWAERLDTSKPGKVPVPRWSLLHGYIRSVSRVNLSRKDRIRCYLVIMEWVPKNAKGLFKDLLVAGLILLIHPTITITRTMKQRRYISSSLNKTKRMLKTIVR